MNYSLRSSNKKAVYLFILLAFCFSYFFISLLMFMPIHNEIKSYVIKIGVTGVALAGIIVAKKQGRLNKLIKSSIPKRKYFVYYMFGIIYFVVTLFSIAVFPIDFTDFLSFTFDNIHLLVFELLFTLIIIGFGEEIGWRGVLLPGLLQYKSPIISSLIIGVIWFLWHLPKLIQWIPHPIFIVNLFLGAIAFSIIFCWIYLKLKADIFLIALIHASYDVAIDWVYRYLTARELDITIADNYWLCISFFVMVVALGIIFLPPLKIVNNLFKI